MSLLLGSLTVVCGIYLWWGFTVLPGERWQILAAVPAGKDPEGSWHGINFTWYGLLTANAYLVAVAVLLALMGAVGVTPVAVALLATVMLLCCVPASRLVAQIVEKKNHTFTVGGAVFVGILIMPLVISLLNRSIGVLFSFHIPMMAACAAIAIAYAFGEGLGRLACISFGCCYGKPVATLPGSLAGWFGRYGFVFQGSTKKIAYADNMEGIRVIPVQALTAVLYTACGLFCTALFLDSRHTTAFLVASVVTQGWRAFSETLRADYRGAGRVSAYRIMGLIGVLYAVGLSLFIAPELTAHVGLATALGSLWRPELILFLQAVWVAIFIYTGRSTVTGATIRLHLHTDRI